jgi:hypothetical protein
VAARDGRPAGYSGTPLARKLGVKPGQQVVLARRPQGWSIPDLPADVTIVDAPEGGANNVGDAHVVVSFHRDRAGLEQDLPPVAGALAPTSALWVAWPRRAGGHRSDITENLLRDLLLPTGLVDVKVAALDDDWSGLKFVWRKERRPTGTARSG